MARIACTALVALAIVASSTPALADCWLNGEQVAEGSRLGERICENGSWVDATD